MGGGQAVQKKSPILNSALALLRQVLIGSGVAAPMFGIHPKTMTDEQLADATRTYKLLHIQRFEACTGPGGPGDLAWVWPLATLSPATPGSQASKSWLIPFWIALNAVTIQVAVSKKGDQE
jgi:hypothetical protein